jgi:hypothetical protein
VLHFLSCSASPAWLGHNLQHVHPHSIQGACAAACAPRLYKLVHGHITAKDDITTLFSLSLRPTYIAIDSRLFLLSAETRPGWKHKLEVSRKEWRYPLLSSLLSYSVALDVEYLRCRREGQARNSDRPYGGRN